MITFVITFVLLTQQGLQPSDQSDHEKVESFTVAKTPISHDHFDHFVPIPHTA